MRDEQTGNKVGGRIAALKPNDFRWVAMYQRPLIKIRILGHDAKALVAGILPKCGIACLRHANQARLRRAGESFRQAA